MSITPREKWSSICRLLPHLFIGDRWASQNREGLLQCGVTHVVNVAGKTCPNSYSDQLTYLTINIDDVGEEDIACHFGSSRQFIGTRIHLYMHMQSLYGHMTCSCSYDCDDMTCSDM